MRFGMGVMGVRTRAAEQRTGEKAYIVGIRKRRKAVLLDGHGGIGAKTGVVEERQLKGRSRGGEEADEESQRQEESRGDTVVSG